VQPGDGQQSVAALLQRPEAVRAPVLLLQITSHATKYSYAYTFQTYAFLSRIRAQLLPPDMPHPDTIYYSKVCVSVSLCDGVHLCVSVCV
jgi:hypothetical protein